MSSRLTRSVVEDAALARLNPTLPGEALDVAFRKLARPEGAELVARNQSLHRLLIDFGGTGRAALDQEEAVALMLEKHEVCCGLFGPITAPAGEQAVRHLRSEYRPGRPHRSTILPKNGYRGSV